MRERSAAVALLAFAAAGLAGTWNALPPSILLLGFGLLPGLAALGACRDGCNHERRECLMEGPAAFPLAAAFSVALLTVPVLPLFALHAPLTEARWTLGAALGLVAAVSLFRPATRAPSVRSQRVRAAEWALASIVLAAVLPAVVHYAGGTVDDWWDLAFVRAYAERPALSFAEPFLGTSLTHPRFAWNGWLVLQALVITFTGADPADVQAGPLAAFVCVASVGAAVAFARGAFGAQKSAPVLAALAFFPLWLWGTEALPYFARLHQDKFVVALVFMPAMLGCAIEYLEGGARRVLGLLIVACLAAATVHGVVFAVGAIGVGICCLVAVARERTPAVLRRVAYTCAVVAAATAYPAWQALALHRWFVAEGISLGAPDNPVVRAHLWLERLVAAHSSAYVVHPAAVFGPVALVMIPAVVLARRLYRDRSWAYTTALAVVPCLVIFVPFVAATAGSLVVPWMLYRIGWLVPVAALAGLCIATLWQRTRERGRAFAAVLVVATFLLAIPTAMDRTRRDMLEHPALRERAPRGSEREVYRFVGLWPESGAVIAPPGFSALVAPMSGRATVAVSERGTLVFSGDEIEAYRRLRDRSAFFAEGTTAAERDRIARAYGVRLAVFRKRLVPEGSERGWLWRATAEGFLQAAARDGARSWTRDALEGAVPSDWRVVLENPDFVVLRTPYAAPDAASRPKEPDARTWLAVFEPAAPDTIDELPVLASIVGYPGARVELAPVPIAVGLTSRPVWTAGALVWDDGPEAVRVRVDLGAECEAKAVTIIPFLRAERREVLEVGVLGVSRRLHARDGEPLTVALPPASVVRELTIAVRSMIGEPFALWDLRVLGDPKTCEGGWQPLVRPDVSAANAGADDLLGLATRYPNDARAVLGMTRRLTAAGARSDAEALLGGALLRDPSAAPAWIELGLMLDADGRFDAALRAYRRGLAADSNNAWAYGCLAWAELRASRPTRALYHAWRASRLDRRYSDAVTIMAAAARRFGLERAAGALLKRAIHLDPHRNWPYLELAQLHVDAGDTRAAVDVLDALLKIVPDDAQARQMMAGLQTGAVPAPSS